MEIEKIKQLRSLTGAGVMDAKRALQENNNVLDAAVAALKEKGLAQAEKRAERTAGSGIVYAYIHGDGQVGVLLELNCETSFVAKTDEFKKLAHELALQIASMTPNSVDDLLAQPYIRDTKITIEQMVKELAGKTGENVRVGKFTRYEVSE